jgi:hypothetical protein
MMKYILLAYRDEKQWETLSAGEHAAFEQACQASEQDLIRSGHLIDVQEMQSHTTLTVRMMENGLSLTDGPLAGRQEQLIQILFIHARDLNAAIQIASQMPQAQAGSIEVRPLME